MPAARRKGLASAGAWGKDGFAGERILLVFYRHCLSVKYKIDLLENPSFPAPSAVRMHVHIHCGQEEHNSPPYCGPRVVDTCNSLLGNIDILSIGCMGR